MKTTNPQLDNAFHNILSCFGGEDGGIAFAKLQSLLISFEDKANMGDDAADKVLQVVIQFSRLIDVAKNH